MVLTGMSYINQGSDAMRVLNHPILGKPPAGRTVQIEVDGEVVEAVEGEPIAAALLAIGKSVFRYTRKRGEPRGVFCAIGRCTDCMMTVDGVPNVRTCVTAVRGGMKVETQHGLGQLRSVVDEG
jgi:predicted molibdopterin-dependent oxidoreductase YjgC